MNHNVGNDNQLPMPDAYFIQHGEISEYGGLGFKSSTEVCGFCPVIVLGY